MTGMGGRSFTSIATLSPWTPSTTRHPPSGSLWSSWWTCPWPSTTIIGSPSTCCACPATSSTASWPGLTPSPWTARRYSRSSTCQPACTTTTWPRATPPTTWWPATTQPYPRIFWTSLSTFTSSTSCSSIIACRGTEVKETWEDRNSCCYLIVLLVINHLRGAIHLKNIPKSGKSPQFSWKIWNLTTPPPRT